MKKLILLVALLSASAVMAQGSRYETIVLDQSGHPVPGAIFTVCSNAGTGTPCTPTVNVYLDQALTIIANPSGFLTADSNGNIGFWAATGTYFYTITGTGLNGRTGYISLGGSGGGGGGTIGGSIALGQIPFGSGANAINGTPNLTWTDDPFDVLTLTVNNASEFDNLSLFTGIGNDGAPLVFSFNSHAGGVQHGFAWIHAFEVNPTSGILDAGEMDFNIQNVGNPLAALTLLGGTSGPGLATFLVPVTISNGPLTMASNFPINFVQGGGSCTFGSPAGINWQICANGSDLQVEHPGAGGNGRFHVDSDFLVGPPGNATSGTNFNSFAWDNQGQYFDAGNGGNNFVLWEIANSVTPAAGIPINSQENIYPIFQNPCTSCTGTVAIGGTGVNSAVGNPVPNPYWILNAFPVVDGFTATLQHIGFSANQTFTFPNATGTIQLTNQPFITASANPALAGVLRLSHSDSINFRNNANSADDTITASASDLPLWNGGAWPGSGGGGVTFPLAANQNANNADTILYTRFTDTSPTGFAWRLQNHAASSTLASLDVSGNLIANTLTLSGQSTFTLLPTGSVQPFFYAESATAGAANIHPGFYEASASPANAFNTFWYPCTAAGKACLSATTPSADSSQTLKIHGPVNPQTGATYPIADADEDGLTTFNRATSIAVSLACPSGTSFLNGWVDDLQQIGAGAPTITVSGCTINGGTTLVVPATGVHLISDGANYWATFNGSGGSGLTLQTIEANNSSQTILDFDASSANVTGLAVTPSNPSGGKEVMEVSGNLNAANITGTIAASHVANIPLNQVISPTSAPAAYSLAGTWNWALDNSTAATVSTTNATPTAQLCAQYWATGGVSTDSCLGETMSFAAGLNGLATVKFANPATTGGTLFDFSNGGTQSDSLTLGPPTSSTANINGVATIFGSSGGSGIVQVEAGGAGGGLKVINSSGTEGMELIPGTVTNGVQQIGITGWAVSNSQIYTVQFKASASVNTGAAVKLDTANAQEIVMTTNADTASPIGIAQQSISANGFGQIIIAGIAGTPTAVKTENTCAIGNDVLVSTVASGVSGNVMCSATPTLGITLGKAMSAATGTAASPATVVVLVQPE